MVPRKLLYVVLAFAVLICGLYAVIEFNKQEAAKKAQEAAEWEQTKAEILEAYPIHQLNSISPNGTIYSCGELQAIYGEMITFCDDSTMYPGAQNGPT